MSEIARERKKEKEFILERPVNGRYRKCGTENQIDRPPGRQTELARQGGRDRRRTESQRETGGWGGPRNRDIKNTRTHRHTQTDRSRKRETLPCIGILCRGTGSLGSLEMARMTPRSAHRDEQLDRTSLTPPVPYASLPWSSIRSLVVGCWCGSATGEVVGW